MCQCHTMWHSEGAMQVQVLAATSPLCIGDSWRRSLTPTRRRSQWQTVAIRKPPPRTRRGLSQAYAKMQTWGLWRPAKQYAALVLLENFMSSTGRLRNCNRSQAQTRGTATLEMILTLINLILQIGPFIVLPNKALNDMKSEMFLLLYKQSCYATKIMNAISVALAHSA